MSSIFFLSFRAALATGVALAAISPAALAKSGTPKKVKSPEQVLYEFQGQTDGGHPNSNLVMDQTGNLYGTTYYGGLLSCEQGARMRPPKRPSGGCGVVFKAPPGGGESVLHAFGSIANDGLSPNGFLTIDSAGDLYGATYYGGSYGPNVGYGTVYELASNGTYTQLYQFQDPSTGVYPQSSLVEDAQGNLYGTASGGSGACGSNGCGIIYEFSASGSYSVLYSFSGQPDGQTPSGALAIDPSGNIYGTTQAGGTSNAGTVFEYTPGGGESVLYSFPGSAGGSYPTGVTIDAQGNLYGPIADGGTGCGGFTCGALFKLAPGGAESTFYAFQGGTDGGFPTGAPVLDSSGNLFGTGAWNAGSIYEVSPTGTETTLTQFVNKGHDGASPAAGVILDQSGNRYGTTTSGGLKVPWPGVVFKFPR